MEEDDLGAILCNVKSIILALAISIATPPFNLKLLGQLAALLIYSIFAIPLHFLGLICTDQISSWMWQVVIASWIFDITVATIAGYRKWVRRCRMWRLYREQMKGLSGRSLTHLFYTF